MTQHDIEKLKEQIAKHCKECLSKVIGDYENVWPKTIIYPEDHPWIKAEVSKNGDAKIYPRKPLQWINLTFTFTPKGIKEIEMEESREQAITLEQNKNTELRGIIEFLWQLLDSIDTYSDMAKDDDGMFRRLVEAAQKRRWETGITSDGYKIDIDSAF